MSDYVLTAEEFAKIIDRSQSFMSMNMHKLGGQVQINGSILYSYEDVRLFLDLYNYNVSAPAKIGKDGKPEIPKKIYDTSHVFKVFKIDKYKLNRLRSKGLFIPKQNATGGYYFTSADIKYLRKVLLQNTSTVSKKTENRDFKGYTRTELADKLRVSYATVTLLMNQGVISLSVSNNGSKYFTENDYSKAYRSLVQYNDTYISPTEAANRLEIDVAKLKYHMNKGLIPDRRFHNGWRYLLQEDIDALARNKEFMHYAKVDMRRKERRNK